VAPVPWLRVWVLRWPAGLVKMRGRKGRDSLNTPADAPRPLQRSCPSLLEQPRKKGLLRGTPESPQIQPKYPQRHPALTRFHLRGSKHQELHWRACVRCPGMLWAPDPRALQCTVSACYPTAVFTVTSACAKPYFLRWRCMECA